MVDLPPAFAAERESLDRSRAAIRDAQDRIRLVLEEHESAAAADIVRNVANDQQVPESTVKMALLVLLQQGEVRLTAGYRLSLANP